MKCGRDLRIFRRTVAALRNPLETEPSLAKAITQLVDQFQAATGVPVHLTLSATRLELPPAERLVLYRLVQEGLTNVQKRARAHQVWVTVGASDHQIQLQVADDGVGMGDDGVEAAFELHDLAEHAAQLGGKLTVQASVQGGVELCLNLPLVQAT